MFRRNYLGNYNIGPFFQMIHICTCIGVKIRHVEALLIGLRERGYWKNQWSIVAGISNGKMNCNCARASKPGLPDGIFSKTKHPNLGKFWRVLQWRTLVYFIAFGLFCIQLLYLGSFWTFCGHLVYFSTLWYAVPRKIWQPCSKLLWVRNSGIDIRLSLRLLHIDSAIRELFQTESLWTAWIGKLLVNKLILLISPYSFQYTSL
jgi:hypothetical protein